MDRIVIIGMGLIGGSLGLALKRAKIKDVEIIGVDEERDAVVQAQRRKAIDRWERPAARAVETADLVIVATPILAMKEVFQEIGPALRPGTVVTDVASTKTEVLRWAAEFLPDHAHFVGGHPMAGKEVSGIRHAEATLFEGTTYCILPGPKAAPAAVDTVVGLALNVGATPYYVDGPEHDVLVGGISHLPLLAASALVEVTTRSPSWREMKKLASSGFRDTSRLASSDGALSHGISLTNQNSLVHWLDEYIEQLREYRELLAAGGQGLAPHLDKAREARDLWYYSVENKHREPDPVMAEIPTFRQQMSDMFTGRLFGGRSFAKVEEDLAERPFGSRGSDEKNKQAKR